MSLDSYKLTEADKILAASENFLTSAEIKEANIMRRLTGNAVEFRLRKPRDILRNPVPQPFQFDEVPPPIASLAKAFCTATGFDHSGIMVAATSAAASVIDDRYQLAVRPGSNWFVSARQWAFLCAPPSGGKSPTIRPVTDPIKKIHDELHSRWHAENMKLEEKDKAPRPAIYTSDATVPALSERLKDNPRGILMLNESTLKNCFDQGHMRAEA